MKIQWDPLIVSGVLALFAAAQYVWGKTARLFAILVAATLAAFVVAIPPLLSLAHHPITSGPVLFIVMPGAAAAIAAFVYLVILGHHRHPLVKKRRGGAPAGQGAAAGGSSPKAPHHRAAVATVALAVFGFLLIANWHSAWDAGRHGVSQTYNGITQ